MALRWPLAKEQHKKKKKKKEKRRVVCCVLISSSRLKAKSARSYSLLLSLSLSVCADLDFASLCFVCWKSLKSLLLRERSNNDNSRRAASDREAHHLAQTKKAESIESAKL